MYISLHMYLYYVFFFRFFSHISHHSVLSRVLCALQSALLVIYIHTEVYVG